jgi:positive regulator of sigma E activity
MKSLLIFFLTLAALLAGVIILGRQIPDAAIVLANSIAASLTAWTARQYDRKFPPLTRVQPLHLPVRDARRKPPAPPRQVAA